MATKLDDKNLKGVIADIPKKGFRTKFWREYRAGACKGSGVGKYMDLLEKMGVPPSGDPSKADLDQMPEIVQAFSMLANAMLKARGKCGKLQSHSRDLCLAYAKLIEKREDAAAELARNADKIKQKQMAQQLKVEKENEETDKHLEKLKKEHDQKNKLVLKELKDLHTRGAKIEGACNDIVKDVKQAEKDLEAVRKAWKTQYSKEGVNREDIEGKADAALRALIKKHKIALHAKNIKETLPKILKEATSLLKQYAKQSGIEKERVATGKALVAAQNSFKSAQDDVRFFLAQHKQALDELQKARPEGV
ncbi:hypothetical protein J4729_07275 [Leisingera sp. HS039]|uniref:hypothetical protein n=1 Tax=unclassified Leisingera TaxID=2614906 RepID=UPI001071113D|nr:MULTISPECIES: hypothetical protein [unclassified Leisingera]MBQ4824351.1 hypothetical protein [Leisingera sp. HS039]QBR34892.1 hypothetical protein ETW23_00590 [Leisingera sp. NJS201]